MICLLSDRNHHPLSSDNMSARASLRLQQTVHQARRTPAAVPSAARQASSTSKQVQPRSFNSLLIGGSIGVAALAASAFAFKVGVTDNRKEAFESQSALQLGFVIEMLTTSSHFLLVGSLFRAQWRDSRQNCCSRAIDRQAGGSSFGGRCRRNHCEPERGVRAGRCLSAGCL